MLFVPLIFDVTIPQIAGLNLFFRGVVRRHSRIDLIKKALKNVLLRPATQDCPSMIHEVLDAITADLLAAVPTPVGTHP